MAREYTICVTVNFFKTPCSIGNLAQVALNARQVWL